MNSIEILKVKELLSAPKKIAIVPHKSPDGDAMGSTLALYHFLKKKGHQPVVVSPNEFPHFLAWLPSSETVLNYENDKSSVAKVLENSDLIFTLDFNVLHRTGEMESVLKNLTAPFIMIDHHQWPDTYATVTYSDTSIGSTCEMVYNFIEFLGEKNVIDSTIATCIYTGMMTDTGSFKFSSTTSKTHRIVAELIDHGAKNSEIHSNVYDSSTMGSLQLLGKALQNLVVFPDLKISYSFLTHNDLEAANYQKGDTEGIVNYGLSLSEIHFTAIFIEHKDENIIKISFRSRGEFDVNKFAREHFNGGGHINAAGGKSFETLEKTIEKFEQIIKNIKIK